MSINWESNPHQSGSPAEKIFSRRARRIPDLWSGFFTIRALPLLSEMDFLSTALSSLIKKVHETQKWNTYQSMCLGWGRNTRYYWLFEISIQKIGVFRLFLFIFYPTITLSTDLLYYWGSTSTGSILDSSSFIRCSANHKSYDCCMRNQSPGPLPANLPILSAISVVIGWVQARTRCNCCREIPRRRAASLTDSPRVGSTSSRRISPGWIGERFKWISEPS